MSLSEAPGRLEQVRVFLNTWRVPHETRTPLDVLPDLLRDPGDWRAQIRDAPVPRRDELVELTEFRAALREALGQPGELRGWLERHPLHVAVGDSGVRYVAGDDTAVAGLLVLVVEAVADGGWARLKACPDCRNVFYDHSRNRSRTWCSMYAETPDGRACGSIAKVRAYRGRKRDG